MKTKTKVKSLFEQEMENPGFRARFEQEHETFKLEVQLLAALERHGLTYSELAQKLHTKKSNISRDLRQGGISSAKIGRIRAMAKALGLTFLPLLVPNQKTHALLPKLEKLMAA